MLRFAKSAVLSALLLLVAGALPGCASDDDPAEENAPVALSPWISGTDLAARLGIPAPVATPTRVLFDSGERRILLFPGQRTASVAGSTLELLHEVSYAGGAVLISSEDASAISVAWRNAPPSTPIPSSSTVGGGSLQLPPPPPPYTPGRPAPAARPAGDNSPSAAEIAAWSVPLKRRWDYIVVHHSASAIGSAAQIDRWHKDKGWDGLGYDFVIGNGTGSPDGAIEVGFRWRQQLVGAHARVSGGSNYMNEHGIGICLVGDFDRTQPSPAQMRSLERLATFLADYCRIPPSNLRLHGEVKSTDCPGKHFPRNFALQPSGRSRTAAGQQSSSGTLPR